MPVFKSTEIMPGPAVTVIMLSCFSTEFSSNSARSNEQTNSSSYLINKGFINLMSFFSIGVLPVGFILLKQMTGMNHG